MEKDREGVNRVLLVGWVSDAPRWHKTGRNCWLHFTLVTEETVHGAIGASIHKERHHICTYGQNPSSDHYDIKKDDVLFIQGRLSTHVFTDADGIKRYKTEIIAGIIERITTQSSLI